MLSSCAAGVRGRARGGVPEELPQLPQGGRPPPLRLQARPKPSILGLMRIAWLVVMLVSVRNTRIFLSVMHRESALVGPAKWVCVLGSIRNK